LISQLTLAAAAAWFSKIYSGTRWLIVPGFEAPLMTFNPSPMVES
jgi:hypothetical protein